MYISEATDDFKKEMLSDILETARKFNKEKGITGLLLYTNETFIQNLEGSKEDVMNLYLKIKQDKRHCSVFEIYSEELEERNFENWSMGYKVPEGIELEEIEGLVNEEKVVGELKKHGAQAMRIMKRIYERSKE